MRYISKKVAAYGQFVLVLNQNYVSNNYFDLCFCLLPAIGTDGYYGQISLLESGNDNYRNKIFPGCT